MTTAPPVPPHAQSGGAGTPEGPGDSPSTAGPPAAPVTVRSGHRLRYAVVGLVLVGALGFLVAKGLGTALNFYLPADQAVAQRATLGTRTFNLEGVVEPGFDPPDTERGGLRRHLGCHEGPGAQQRQPARPLPAQHPGHRRRPLRRSTFVSDQILVKHSSNYIAQHPGRVTAPNGTKR